MGVRFNNNESAIQLKWRCDIRRYRLTYLPVIKMHKKFRY